MIGFLMRVIGLPGRHNEFVNSINYEKEVLQNRKNILNEQEQRANNEIDRLEALGVQVRVKARDYDRESNG